MSFQNLSLSLSLSCGQACAVGPGKFVAHSTCCGSCIACEPRFAGMSTRQLGCLSTSRHCLPKVQRTCCRSLQQKSQKLKILSANELSLCSFKPWQLNVYLRTGSKSVLEIKLRPKLVTDASARIDPCCLCLLNFEQR